eukprot:2343770-Rhodomonas_salina.2
MRPVTCGWPRGRTACLRPGSTPACRVSVLAAARTVRNQMQKLVGAQVTDLAHDLHPVVDQHLSAMRRGGEEEGGRREGGEEVRREESYISPGLVTPRSLRSAGYL